MVKDRVVMVETFNDGNHGYGGNNYVIDNLHGWLRVFNEDDEVMTQRLDDMKKVYIIDDVEQLTAEEPSVDEKHVGFSEDFKLYITHNEELEGTVYQFENRYLLQAVQSDWNKDLQVKILKTDSRGEIYTPKGLKTLLYIHKQELNDELTRIKELPNE